MSNLTKRYEDIEGEKHTFVPKINKQNLNYHNDNKFNISIKKNNQNAYEYFKHKCSNDKELISKETPYPIHCSQSSQYNNYIIQSNKNKTNNFSLSIYNIL